MAKKVDETKTFEWRISHIPQILEWVEVGSYLCPRCLEGKMVAIKDGETANGDKYRSFVCSNNEGGCDFFETKYGDLTPPLLRK